MLMWGLPTLATPDRCLAVAADGSIIDGDHILAGSHSQKEADLGTWHGRPTVIANLGFKIAIRDIGNHRVGNGGRRQVRPRGNERWWLRPGWRAERSHRDDGTRCYVDGVLTALHVLAIMAKTGRSLADLSSCVRQTPPGSCECRVNKERCGLQ